LRTIYIYISAHECPSKIDIGTFHIKIHFRRVSVDSNINGRKISTIRSETLLHFETILGPRLWPARKLDDKHCMPLIISETGTRFTFSKNGKETNFAHSTIISQNEIEADTVSNKQKNNKNSDHGFHLEHRLGPSRRGNLPSARGPLAGKLSRATAVVTNPRTLPILLSLNRPAN
jgi:hypothetical protein